MIKGIDNFAIKTISSLTVSRFISEMYVSCSKSLRIRYLGNKT